MGYTLSILITRRTRDAVSVTMGIFALILVATAHAAASQSIPDPYTVATAKLDAKTDGLLPVYLDAKAKIGRAHV